MLQNKRAIIIPVTFIFLILAIYYLFKFKNRFLRLSLLFIVSGAAGNFIDRATKVSVTDFFQFQFGSYYTPIFNIADMFIISGTFMLAYYLIFNSNKKEAESNQ